MEIHEQVASHDLSTMFDKAGTKLKKLETKMKIEDDIFQARPTRKYIASMMRTRRFEVVLFTIILSNFFCTIYETDLQAADEPVPFWLSFSFYIFLAFYVVEVTTRLIVYERFFFTDRMNTFDLIITAFDVITTALSPFIGNTPSSSVMRIFRVTRIVRIVKAVRHFRELYLMLHGLIDTMKAISWAIVMIFVVLTCCSLVAVEVLHPINLEIAADGKYADCERCPRAFESVMESNLTFIQQILAGDSWGQVSLPIIAHSPWTAVFFVGVLVLINLGLMNLVLTVIVDSAQEARSRDYEAKLVEKLSAFRKAKEGFCKICAELDTNESGTLSLEELLDGYDNVPEFANMLEAMDAGREDLPTVFQILDEDCSGDVTYTEFVDQLQKLKSQDSHTLLVFVKCYLTELKRQTVEMFRFGTADYFPAERARKHGFVWQEKGSFGAGLYYFDDMQTHQSSTESTIDEFVEMLDRLKTQDFISRDKLIKEGITWHERGPLGKGMYMRRHVKGVSRKDTLRLSCSLSDAALQLPGPPPSFAPVAPNFTLVENSFSKSMGEDLITKCDELDSKLTRISDYIFSVPGKSKNPGLDEPKDVHMMVPIADQSDLNSNEAEVSSSSFTRLCSIPAKAQPKKAYIPPVNAQIELESLQHGIAKAVAAAVQESLLISNNRAFELTKTQEVYVRRC